MTDFRDRLETELAKHVFDWSPLPKQKYDLEIIEDIARSFCTREQLSFVSLAQWTPESLVVTIDGVPSLNAHAKWRTSFMEFGYTPPILVWYHIA